MKIDKVILAVNNNKDYLDFWPIVSDAWKRLGVEPLLIYTGKEKLNLEGNVINFHVQGIDPVFVAQNIRILAPALFPSENSITADIDDLPLSKKYFIDNVKDVPEHMFVVYRWGFITETMIPICWTLANGKVWKDIFNIQDENDIVNRLIKWYPLNYRKGNKNWYTDQLKLKKYISKFDNSNPNRVIFFNDQTLHFNRIDRTEINSVIYNLESKKVEYSDYHMPIPLNQFKETIYKVYELSKNNGYI
tara:strand:+ start:19825 stop:20565 length:741 start_codon:yes stop_codon:yes gene_type:complete